MTWASCHFKPRETHARNKAQEKQQRWARTAQHQDPASAPVSSLLQGRSISIPQMSVGNCSSKTKLLALFLCTIALTAVVCPKTTTLPLSNRNIRSLENFSRAEILSPRTVIHDLITNSTVCPLTFASQGSMPITAPLDPILDLSNRMSNLRLGQCELRNTKIQARQSEELPQEEGIEQRTPGSLKTKGASIVQLSQTPPLSSISCLEDDLKEQVCVNLDVDLKVATKINPEFAHYLAPNEGTPTSVRPHLDLMSQGLIVSVGTERSFFDLILSDSKKCEGLIVRDINPRVKAYVDFNVLLLRLSVSRQEYSLLAQTPENEKAYLQRLDIIREKIQTNLEIPPFLKEYYQKNLDAFSHVYYSTPRFWTLPSHLDECDARDFEGVNYHESDAFFAKLQKYAKSGKIVATIGSINDLQFLQYQRISVVDVSNVPDYCFIDLEGYSSAAPPRVIWTELAGKHTNYASFLYSPLTLQEKKEFDQLLEQLKSSREPVSNTWDLILFLQSKTRLHRQSDPGKNTVPGASYSHETLEMLKTYCTENLYEFPGFGYVDMGPLGITKIYTVPNESLAQAVKDPRFAGFVKELEDRIPAYCLEILHVRLRSCTSL